MVSICHCCEIVVAQARLCTMSKHAQPVASCRTEFAQPVASCQTEFACFVVWPMCTGLLFFWFGIHTASVPSTAETRTGGGVVLEKPGGRPARRHSLNIVLR